VELKAKLETDFKLMMNPILKRAGQLSFCAILAILAAGTAQAGFPANQSTTNNPAAPTEEGVEAVAEEVLVRFKPGASEEQVAKALAKIGGKVKARKNSRAMAAFGEPGFAKVATALPAMNAVKALANDPAVDVAEPNYIYRKQQLDPSTVIVNDFYYGDPSSHARQFPLWGTYGSAADNIAGPAYVLNQFGAQADEAWYLTWDVANSVELKDVVVGIIDEGVSVRHPDLQANVWVNPAESGLDAYGNDKATNKLDDDGNGYIDDVNGWDFFNNDATVFDKVANVPDADSHGTHVAGTIGAEANNGYGIAGVHHGAKMIAAKFLGPDGGDTADAIDAINYFIDLKLNHGVNIVALNNSWGGGGYSSLLHAAIIRAAKVGILFVAAAGNGNWMGVGQDNDRYPSYPASYDTTQTVTISGLGTLEAGYDSVIAVAAIDKNGARAGFSNYGAKSVDLAAPGVDIISAHPWDVDHPSTVPNEENAREWCYWPLNGTSMATPHVTGAAALYAARHPQASPAAIKKALLDKTIYTQSMAGRSVSNGRLNLARLSETPVEPASKPLAFKVGQATANGAVVRRTALLTWEDSVHETAYELQRSTSSNFSKNLKVYNTIGADSTSFTDTALTSGTTYYYRLRALSPVANSVYTATVSFRAP
jgi:subtilisin family serine protease